MRIAALYDIHGNLPALEAVLDDVRRANVDQIIVGGDVVPGPMPRETIELLLNVEIPTQFIRGNGDRVVLAQMRGTVSPEVPEQFREGIRWNAQQLNTEHERLISTWSQTVSIDAGELESVLFCHATPRNDTDIFTRQTPEEPLLRLFEGLNASIVVCGHTHMQFDRMIGSIRVVNAGSLGMPFGRPAAYWLLLASVVELRRTDYDLTAAAERVRATDYPRAHDFATNNILHPPSEEEILNRFSNAEVR
jgi:putative phosphoesterase